MKGPSQMRGIFIGSVEAGSLADKAGIKIGDQITAMNNHNVFNAELSKVLDLVRSTNTMELVVKRGAGIDLFPEAKANRRKLASSSLLPMVFEEDAGLQTEKVKSDLEENDNHQIQSTPLVETETLKEELPKEMEGLNQKTTKENELPKSEGKSRFCTNISLDQRDPGKVQDHQQTETRRKLREDIINSGQQYKEKTADNEITNQPRNFSKSGYLPSPTIRPHAFISRVSSQPYSESSQGHRIMSVVSRKSSASGSDMEPFYYYSYQTKRSPSLTSKGTSSVELCGDDETPITDSRGPQPKIPEIYFDEGARKPLVTIDTFRPQNRFISQEKPQNRETKSDETAPLAEMLNRSVTRPEVKPTTEEELNMNVNFDSNHPGSNTETKSEPGVVNTTVDKPPLAPSTGKNLPSQSLSVSEPDLSSPKDSVNSGKIQSLISRTPEEDCKLNMNKLSPTSSPVFWNSLLEQTCNKQQKKREFPKSSVAAPNLTVSLRKSPLYQNQISNSDSNLFKKTINPLFQGVLRYSVSVEKNLNFNVHANPSVLSVKSPVVKNSQKFLTVDNR
ncbi:uncharacterized protein LOC106476249 [Limulus polyphemus]|uniref:Uncharacterized protein LOC106476249 n=1 Tax=Limulus polyphemus TaxID=6850 RepID=A0ABM1RWX8_LIMPO|nr:uncharacterized protein LOC106476249 [Limulus polyphemus]